MERVGGFEGGLIGWLRGCGLMRVGRVREWFDRVGGMKGLADRMD